MGGYYYYYYYYLNFLGPKLYICNDVDAFECYKIIYFEDGQLPVLRAFVFIIYFLLVCLCEKVNNSPNPGFSSKILNP